MNYTQKYIKYKKKYLELKGGTIKTNYLPCEISHTTHTLYMHKSVLSKLVSLNLQCIINQNGNEKYQQDPAIFLKGTDGSDTAIKVKDGLDLTNFKIIDVKHITANDFGGNFIASFARDDHPYGTVFYFDKVNPTLISKLQELSSQNFVSLSCSFRYDDERHIDECMTFMPYKDKYKVWIYKIRNIKYSSGLQDRINNYEKCDIVSINAKLKRMSESSGATKTAINNILNPESDKIQESLQCKALQQRLPIHELDFIKKYYSPDSLDQQFEFFRNIDNIKTFLETERVENLNLISNELFGLPYADCMDNFVEFPIDLEITHDLKYKITTIPIFNRVWYETPTECIALFSSTNDREICNIVDNEMKLIGSLIDCTKPFSFEYIDTLEFHNQGNVGGNLHCMIKSKY
jgi:hypothetical protein